MIKGIDILYNIPFTRRERNKIKIKEIIKKLKNSEDRGFDISRFLLITRWSKRMKTQNRQKRDRERERERKVDMQIDIADGGSMS